jgi:hypothetical protein
MEARMDSTVAQDLDQEQVQFTSRNGHRRRLENSATAGCLSMIKM